MNISNSTADHHTVLPGNWSDFSLENSAYCAFTYTVSKNSRLVLNTITAWQAISGTIAILGIATNFLVLTLLARFPQLRQGAGILIIHLLLSNFAHLVFALAVTIPRAGTVSLLTGLIDCRSCQSHAVHARLNALVNWTEALLAFNRLVAVFFPLRFQAVNRYSVQISTLSVCWIVVLCYNVPPIFEYHSVFKLTSLGTFAIIAKSNFMTAILSFNGYCPLDMILLTSVFIVGRNICGKNRGRNGDASAAPSDGTSSNARSMTKQRGTISQREVRTSKMLTVSFLFSLICQVPQYAAVLFGMLGAYPLLALLFWCFSVVQVATIPIIFLTMNQDYRRKTALLFHSPCGPASSDKSQGVSESRQNTTT